MQFTITVDRSGLHIESGRAQAAAGLDTAGSEVRVASIDLPHVKGPTLALLDDAGTLQTIGSLDEFADKIAARIRADGGLDSPPRPDAPGGTAERPDTVKHGPPDGGQKAS